MSTFCQHRLVVVLTGLACAASSGCTVGYPAGAGPQPGLGLTAWQEFTSPAQSAGVVGPDAAYVATPELPLAEAAACVDAVPGDTGGQRPTPLRDLLAHPPEPAPPPAWFNPVPTRPAFYPQR